MQVDSVGSTELRHARYICRAFDPAPRVQCAEAMQAAFVRVTSLNRLQGVLLFLNRLSDSGPHFALSFSPYLLIDESIDDDNCANDGQGAREECREHQKQRLVLNEGVCDTKGGLTDVELHANGLLALCLERAILAHICGELRTYTR